MTRPLSALLLALGLLLTGACGNQSGDSNPDNQQDQAPGQEDADDPGEIRSS